MVGSPRNHFAMVENIREFYAQATWLAHSSGSQTFTLCAIAIATGAHIRVGFDDSAALPHKAQPRSNAEFVEWAVTLARLHGREPSTTAQARELLGLLSPPLSLVLKHRRMVDSSIRSGTLRA